MYDKNLFREATNWDKKRGQENNAASKRISKYAKDNAKASNVRTKAMTDATLVKDGLAGLINKMFPPARITKYNGKGTRASDLPKMGLNEAFELDESAQFDMKDHDFVMKAVVPKMKGRIAGLGNSNVGHRVFYTGPRKGRDQRQTSKERATGFKVGFYVNGDKRGGNKGDLHSYLSKGENGDFKIKTPSYAAKKQKQW